MHLDVSRVEVIRWTDPVLCAGHTVRNEGAVWSSRSSSTFLVSLQKICLWPVCCACGLTRAENVGHLHVVSGAGERSWLTWVHREVLRQVPLPCLRERSSAGVSSKTCRTRADVAIPLQVPLHLLLPRPHLQSAHPEIHSSKSLENTTSIIFSM